MTDKEEYYMVERIGNVAKRMENFGFFHASSESFSVEYASCEKRKRGDIYLDNGMEILLPRKQKIWKQELTAWLSAWHGAPGEDVSEMDYVLYCFFQIVELLIHRASSGFCIPCQERKSRSHG